MDELTALFRQFLKLFGADYPIRVGVGICAGYLLKIICSLGAAYFPNALVFITLNNLPLHYLCAATVLLIFAPLAFGRKGAPESVVQQVKTIQLLTDAGKFSPQQEKLIWHSLVKKYLDSVKPDLNTAPIIDLVEEAEKEIATQPSKPESAA